MTPTGSFNVPADSRVAWGNARMSPPLKSIAFVCEHASPLILVNKTQFFLLLITLTNDL